MGGLIIACVRTGQRYPISSVAKLHSMVARHLTEPYRMVCLTDQNERCPGVEFVDIAPLRLDGWWGKMALFRKEWRGDARVVYIDLDTVIINSLAPLAAVDAEFAICENFTRRAGNTGWPCKYGSCVMVISGGWHAGVWNVFEKHREWMRTYARWGDQKVIEEIYPVATLLQSILPENYFMSYRALTMRRPADTAVINFGGAHKPDNCTIPWIAEEWQ